MALSTQVLLLCLCSFVAESFFFELGGQDLHRIPLGLSEGFMIYPGMFDRPHIRYSNHHSKDIVKGNQKRPFTSIDITTATSKVTEPIASVTTTEVPVTVTKSEDDDIEVKIQRQEKQEPLEDKDVFLTKNVNINDATETLSKKEFQVNTLSIHDVKPEPILSVTIPQDSEEEKSVIKNQAITDVQINANKTNDTKTQSMKQDNKDDPGLSKNTDFILVPVTAVNPTATSTIQNQDSILNRNQNVLTPMANLDNNNQVYSIPNVSNNMNPGVPYGSAPNQYINNGNSGMPWLNNVVNPSNNGAPANLYTVMTVPNNGQGISNGNMPNNNNMYYLLNNPNTNNMGNQNPNTQQYYNLVPINNPPNNIAWNQQPVPPNNPQYFVPINNQPNNVIPFNNQPNNFVGNNQPNNFIPWNNNQPNTYPYNNNFVPINNVPNNYVPINNLPNNFVPLNNQPTNFIPFNDPQNIVPLNNQPVGVPNNNVPLLVQPQPNTVTLLTFKDKEEDKARETVSE